MSSIMPIPVPPSAPSHIFTIIGEIVKAIKAFFTPPKPKESPEDVMERQRAFQFFFATGFIRRQVRWNAMWFSNWTVMVRI